MSTVLFCPDCRRIVEYDSYYQRTYCTGCTWSQKKDFQKNKQASPFKQSATPKKVALKH